MQCQYLTRQCFNSNTKHSHTPVQPKGVHLGELSLTLTHRRGVVRGGTIVEAGPRDGHFSNMFADVAAMDRLMARQMSLMDRQMAGLTRTIDREVAGVMGGLRVTDADRMRPTHRQVLQQTGPWGAHPNVHIERSEEKGSNSYRFYESISITPGSSYQTYSLATHAPSLSPFLFIAMLLAGAYTAVAMSAARNFHQTTYKDSSKWWMVLLWPVLAILSPSYREQLDTVLRGTMDSSEDESN